MKLLQSVVAFIKKHPKFVVGGVVVAALVAFSYPSDTMRPQSEQIRTEERITPDPNFTPKPTKEPTPTAVPTMGDESSAAYIHAKNAIRAILKAPSTADFPWLDYDVIKTTDTIYRVVSYVDAENSFGAKIRSDWGVTLEYKGGTPSDVANWSFLSVTFDGEEYIK